MAGQGLALGMAARQIWPRSSRESSPISEAASGYKSGPGPQNSAPSGRSPIFRQEMRGPVRVTDCIGQNCGSFRYHKRLCAASIHPGGSLEESPVTVRLYRVNLGRGARPEYRTTSVVTFV